MIVTVSFCVKRLFVKHSISRIVPLVFLIRFSFVCNINLPLSTIILYYIVIINRQEYVCRHTELCNYRLVPVWWPKQTDQSDHLSSSLLLFFCCTCNHSQDGRHCVLTHLGVHFIITSSWWEVKPPEVGRKQDLRLLLSCSLNLQAH